MNHAFTALPCLFALAASTVRMLPAQCTNQWLPVNDLPGTYTSIQATTTWDPDGSGPANPVVAVTFPQGGDIATWDPGTGAWSTLPQPLANANPGALVALANGDLIAAVASTAPTHHVMRWNGTTWSTIGTANGAIAKLVAQTNGDLAIGGSFTTVAGVAANCVARWDGSSWHALGSGVPATTTSYVLALTGLANGDLVVGGAFSTAGGVACSSIARWNGTTWSPLAAGILGAVVLLTTMPNGDVVASGGFATAGGVAAPGIARWNGVAWSAMGVPPSGAINALQPLPNGDLVVAGYLEGPTMDWVAIAATWNGATWSSMPIQGLVVWSLTCLANGDLLFGGTTNLINSNMVLPAPMLARLAGNTWSALYPSFSGPIQAMATNAQGDVVVVGSFNSVGGVSAGRIARCSNGAWFAMGSGPVGTLQAIAILPNGHVVVGGAFSQIDGVPANNVALWDGTNWSSLGSGLTGAISGTYAAALVVSPNGDLLVGGTFQWAGGTPANSIARWNGVTWSALGGGVTGGSSPSVEALLVATNGHVIAGGRFWSAGGSGNIAHWDGNNWSAMGGGLGGFGGGSGAGVVRAVTEMPNGDIVAGGMWAGPPSSCIARWNGAAWTPVGIGVGGAGIQAVSALPNGDVLAGGSFTLLGSANSHSLARWNGTNWSVPTASLTAPPFMASEVRAVRALLNGDILVGGNFVAAGTTLAPYHCVLATTCPALATTTGSGCTGSGGANVLTATSLPWIGSTFSATATSMPALGLAIGVRGLTTTSIPLSTILPQGTAGCSLLVSPDLLDLYVPTAGAVTTSFAIPNTIALANQVLHQQVVALDLTPLGAITALTSTNALTLTIGSF